MDAGRKLDALVAEYVIGGYWEGLSSKIARNDGTIYNYPKYSSPTAIAAAWQVVEAMAQRGFWCQMRTPFQAGEDGDGYWAGFTPHGTTGWNGKPDHWTQSEALTSAICLAALKAVGIEA